MSSASAFSGETTMIANSYLTFFKIFSADPAIRRCFKVGFIFCFNPFSYGADFKRIKSYNSPAPIATELFKPSTDSTSLLVSIKKTLFDLGGGFSLCDVTNKAGF